MTQSDYIVDTPRPNRVADLSPDDKPREKAMRHGIKALSNAELLAIILGSGIPGLSVVDLSKQMLRDCDNKLSILSSMSIAEIVRKYKGIGPAKAVSLAAAIELGIRCRDEEIGTEPLIRSSDDVFRIMRPIVSSLPHEEFWLLILSRANRVKHRCRISSGGTAATVVDIKMIMKTAVDHLASAIILVHNHPSGNDRPSHEDDELTRRIREAGKLLDIRVLDHVIVARDRYYSYGDDGRM